MSSSSSFAKIALSIACVAAIAAYAIWRSLAGEAPITMTGAEGSILPTDSTQAGRYKDGSYLGTATDAFFGIVQVKAIVQGGKLTDVEFIQYPDEQGYTVELSTKIMPALTREAITIQSAEVDIISGATQTVEGFQTSLDSALAKAVN